MKRHPHSLALGSLLSAALLTLAVVTAGCPDEGGSGEGGDDPTDTGAPSEILGGPAEAGPTGDADACAASCTGKCAGDTDGCGGQCPDPCQPGQSCQAGACTTLEPKPDVQQDTSDAACVPSCEGKCDGASDGCDGICAGGCPDGQTCEGGTCVCQPDCAMRMCGDGGCPDQPDACGTCGQDEVCDEDLHFCMSTLPCMGIGEVVGACDSLDDAGCCEDASTLVFCYGDDRCKVDCGEYLGAGAVDSCGWDHGTSMYWCANQTSPDPSGDHPLLCGDNPCATTSCDDGDPCTKDTCDPFAGCAHAWSTDPCDDGDACTLDDACQDGVCVGAPKSCGPEQTCDPTTGECVGGCSPVTETCNGQDDDCDGDTDEDFGIGEACDGDDQDSCANGTKVCASTTTTTCAESSSDACDGVCGGASDGCGGTCDGDCDPGMTCVATKCQPVACDIAACDDDDPCTEDTCDPSGACAHAPAEGPCDDGDPCTSDDACAEGLCIAGAPTNCDDMNLCTDDSCDPATGCTTTNNAVGCDDGNACTTGDTCAGGVCNGGTSVVCNDGKVCTDDVCDPASGCKTTNNTAACDDGNACTQGDTCAAGACQPGSTVACDDGAPCTDDSCDPGTGCTFTNNAAPCDDGSACTVGDACAAGTCKGGAAVTCNDSLPCTDDSCDPASGCKFVNNAAACDDGSACTLGDSCAGGACQAGSPVICDDSNPCTDDLCLPAVGCTTTPLTGPTCGVGKACYAGVCEDIPCTPDCSGKPCGDDGCGGACPDTCAPYEECSANQCVTIGYVKAKLVVELDTAAVPLGSIGFKFDLDPDVFEALPTGVELSTGATPSVTLFTSPDYKVTTSPNGASVTGTLAYFTPIEAPSDLFEVNLTPKAGTLPSLDAIGYIPLESDFTDELGDYAVGKLKLTLLLCTADGACTCVPSACAGKECGDDGCGGSCGECGPGTGCGADGTCACLPDCGAKQCGDDGCGGQCPNLCSGGQECVGTSCIDVNYSSATLHVALSTAAGPLGSIGFKFTLNPAAFEALPTGVELSSGATPSVSLLLTPDYKVTTSPDGVSVSGTLAFFTPINAPVDLMNITLTPKVGVKPTLGDIGYVPLESDFTDELGDYAQGALTLTLTLNQ